MKAVIQELVDLQNLLDCTFDEFQETQSCNLSKQYHGDSLSYSVFINSDEYIFVDDKLHSIEFYKYNSLFYSIEYTISKLNEYTFRWSFFQKYTFDKYLIIKVQDYIYLEYCFDSGNTPISLIRISNKE